MRLRRQIWAVPTPTTSVLPSHCTPFKLSAGGLVNIGHDTVITLSQNAVFQPACSGLPPPQPLDVDDLGTDTSVIDPQDPFYASTTPQIYAIAAATIVSYMLVIILFITPRTFHMSGVAGGGYIVGQNTSVILPVIGARSRPWLQKVAALTVAVSLTIATADTFKVAENQYYAGYQDANALTDMVVGGMEIRIVRVISDTCLWLAQVQTLIRLFTRHKEKVIIKWIGFGLIVLDTIFSILNYFVVDSKKTRPRRFVSAIPALNYLFTLALSLLYAAWVINYALSKHRYAFYHRKMRNMFLIAIIAICAIHVPVVFFVLDIAQPNAAGWGNYVRWVGAAAASVVVWEWVERIEALERDEKKDGILGREIFAGDEMLEVTPSTEANPSRYSRDNNRKQDGRRRQTGGTGTGRNGIRQLKNRLVALRHLGRDPRHQIKRWENRGDSTTAPAPEHPISVASPVSRADTTSATSTVYVVHYHQDNDPTLGMPSFPEPRIGVTFADSNREITPVQNPDSIDEPSSWQRITQKFKSKHSSPPEIIQAHANRREESFGTLAPKPDEDSHTTSFLDKFRPKKTAQVDLSTLPRMVIPPPRRGIDMLVEAERVSERNRIGPSQNLENPSVSALDVSGRNGRENPPSSNPVGTHSQSPYSASGQNQIGRTLNNRDLNDLNRQERLSSFTAPSTSYEALNTPSPCPGSAISKISGDINLEFPNQRNNQ